MSMNAEGDLQTFITSTVTYSAAIVVMWLGFCVFRLRYPIMYSNNVLEGWAPKVPPETYFGWFGTTTSLTLDEVTDSVGLDAAMLLEYTHLCMKVLAAVGIPMIFVVGPMNWAFGENRAGKDHLSYLSFGNVVDGSWLYWVHAFVVLAVVILSTHYVHDAMRAFLPRRFKWLREVSHQQANTVLVECIPDEFQSEEELKKFMQLILPGAGIKSVYVCKDTTDLEAFVSKYENAEYSLKVAEGEWSKAANAPDCRPMVRDPAIGSKVEAIPYWQSQQKELMKQIKDERARIEREQHTVGGVNTSSGFVTFTDRSSAEILLRLDGQIASDMDLWNLDNAPEPDDILWHDLTQDITAEEVRTFVGYGLVAGLFFAYMPLVIGVTNLAKLIDFKQLGLPFLQSFWAGLAPTMGLQFMVAMLPTFLVLILSNFFTLKSMAYLQHKIQIWYFWFQVVFVILATAVGQNFMGFVNTLIEDPLATFGVLAETMPYATHFYMNYLVLQWLSHTMNFTRYVPLIKYKGFSQIFSEADAKKMAEPEDQDYYGIGGRSARWATVMAIGLVFGTLSPPINLLCFINFAFCRVVYGYLLCFAETRKPDLGGVYWVTLLRHFFMGGIIYTILMIGVFLHRAANYGPAIIAAPSLAWVLVSKARFDKYSWEKLPVHELVQSKSSKQRPDMGQYVQPELLKPAF